MVGIPRIISVDDHVTEPPDLWTSRLPKKFVDQAPHVTRDKMIITGGPKGSDWEESDDGEWCDIWRFGNFVLPLWMSYVAVGFKTLSWTATTFDEIRPGCWDQSARLKDMEDNHVEAALCFPNTLPRFCGQTFYEAPDKELALLCVKAYNDWIIDDWGGGEAKDRLLPVSLIPLWDVDEAVKEIHRCAAKGSHAVSFPENPFPLGLPSLHDKSKNWWPLFTACQETDTVVCMHIGSSSQMPSTSPDAPFIVSSALTFQNAMGSLMDYIFSGTLEQFPKLKIAYAEGQIGWMPYVIERADKLWMERDENSFGSALAQRPSTFIPERVFGCVFDDEVGLANRNRIGVDQICFETDYPHADTTFPHSKKTFEEICTNAGMNDEEIYKLARGNAIRAFGLERNGITV